jgi:hypothetical protein
MLTLVKFYIRNNFDVLGQCTSRIFPLLIFQVQGKALFFKLSKIRQPYMKTTCDKMDEYLSHWIILENLAELYVFDKMV